MITNYFLIAFRNLKKNPLHSSINVIGLCIGIAAVIMIFSYVRFETSYDKHILDHERIYRISLSLPEGNLEREIATVGPVVHRTFPSEFSEIELSTRLMNTQFSGNKQYVRIEENVFPDQKIYFGDSTFFDVFQFPLIAGNPSTALAGVGKVVITRDAAIKYFGGVDCMGKYISVNNQNDYVVSGIMETIPPNTHFHFDILVGMESHPWEKQAEWNGIVFATYFLLREGVDPVALSDKIDQYIKKLTEERGSDEGSEGMMPLQPIADIHLQSHKEMELEANGDTKYVVLFSSIALFILLIACINYINLATSQSMERAREVGLRKIFGAFRSNLIYQFLGESIVVSFLAFLLSLGVIEIFRPYFNRLVNMHLTYDFFFENKTWLYYIIFIFCLSIFAGLYPALFLSRYMPEQVLKGKFSRSRSAVRFRKSLVVVQFCISVFLIIGSLVVYSQLKYMLSKDLGIEKEHIVAVPFYNAEMRDKSETIKEEMTAHHSIISATAVSQLPVNIDNSEGISNNMSWSSDDPQMFFLHADKDFLKTMGVNLLYGRMFTRDYSGEYTEYIVNKTGMHVLGESPETIFNRNIRIKHDGITLGPVIGVVEDFNFASLHDQIGPLVISQDPIWYSYLLFRILPGDPTETLAIMKNSMNEILPEVPFEYRFLDQEFDTLYKSEIRLSRIVAVFTILAIFIACIGLFSLIAFDTMQRTKEIGVRKVLGSTTVQVVSLFVTENIKLITISMIIALPAAYFIMNIWLRDFAYRIQVGFDIVLEAVLFVMAITVITVTYHAIKAAFVNPSETLRYE